MLQATSGVLSRCRPQRVSGNSSTHSPWQSSITFLRTNKKYQRVKTWLVYVQVTNPRTNIGKNLVLNITRSVQIQQRDNSSWRYTYSFFAKLYSSFFGNENNLTTVLQRNSRNLFILLMPLCLISITSKNFCIICYSGAKVHVDVGYKNR